MNKITKIVYIDYQPYSTVFEEEFFLHKIIAQGLTVEYWDLCGIFFKNKFEAVPDEAFVIKINSYKSLVQQIKKDHVVNTLYVLHINYRGLVIWLFYLLSKYKCRMIYISRIPLPNLYENQNYNKINTNYNRIKKIFIFKEVKRHVLDILSVYLKKFKIINNYFAVFIAGNYGHLFVGRGWKYDLKKAKVIKVNSVDYDKYLNIYMDKTHSNEIVEGKYIVFIDQYLPFHQDFIITKTNTVDANDYYNSMNTFFDNIESLTGYKIVIAAHPKSHKYRTRNYYDGREVIFGETAKLIGNSEAVITHNSTAIGYAVLFNKKTLFITNKSINKFIPSMYEHIKYFSQTLGSGCININEVNDINDIKFYLDETKYEIYKYNYLTNLNTEKMLTEQIFIDYLLDLDLNSCSKK